MAAVFIGQAVYAAPGNSADNIPTLENFTAEDMPYDGGGDILLRWPVDKAAEGVNYEIYAAAQENTEWKLIESLPAFEKTADKMKMPFWAWKHGSDEYAVKIPIKSVSSDAETGMPLFFKIKAVKDGNVISESPAKGKSHRKPVIRSRNKQNRNRAGKILPPSIRRWHDGF